MNDRAVEDARRRLAERGVRHSGDDACTDDVTGTSPSSDSPILRDASVTEWGSLRNLYAARVLARPPRGAPTA